MKLTPNQTLNLLWSHYCDPESPLRLKETEVVDLELDLVSQFDDLEPSSYVDQLTYTTKESLIGFLINNTSKSMFN